MDLTKVIRISDVLGILPIGLYWIIFPNDFSEPLIIILGCIAVLAGEIINVKVRDKDEKKNKVASNVYWTVFIIVFIFSCLGVYTFHYYSNENEIENMSPLVIIGSLLFSFFVFWIGFHKQIQRYFDLPSGYLIIDTNERKWKNIHPEKALEIKYYSHLLRKRDMVQFRLENETVIEPGKEKDYSDVDGYKGILRDEIKSISFTESFYSKYLKESEESTTEDEK